MDDLSKAFFLKTEIEHYHESLNSSYMILEECLKRHGFEPKKYSLNENIEQSTKAVVVFRTDLLFELYHPDVYADDIGLLAGKYDEQLHSFLSFNPTTPTEKKLVKSLTKRDKDEIIQCFLQIKHYTKLIVEADYAYSKLRDKIITDEYSESKDNKGTSKNIQQKPIDNGVNSNAKENSRSADNRIHWIKSRKQLIRLFELLHENQFVSKRILDQNVMDSHFRIEDEITEKTGMVKGRRKLKNTGIMTEVDSAIVWQSSKSLLVYLLNLLIYKKYIHRDEVYRRHALVARHFLDRKRKAMEAKLLTQTERQYLNNKRFNQKPKDAEIIEEVVMLIEMEG